MNNNRLDELLESEMLEPPAGFLRQVMQRIHGLPPSRPARSAPGWVPWVVVICGVVSGVGELTSFIFSAWIAATVH